MCWREAGSRGLVVGQSSKPKIVMVPISLFMIGNKMTLEQIPLKRMCNNNKKVQVDNDQEKAQSNRTTTEVLPWKDRQYKITGGI